LNNFEVLKSAVGKDQKVLGALQQIKEVAHELADQVQKGQFQSFGSLFQAEYEARTKLCEDFSSPEIRKLNEISLANGAEALKICGAGGGGCVLVWCKPELQQKVGDACQKAGFQVLGAKPVSPL
jgi:D-glycero-alpha-D-manno-heptose-7-phosphate kinase